MSGPTSHDPFEVLNNYLHMGIESLIAFQRSGEMSALKDAVRYLGTAVASAPRGEDGWPDGPFCAERLATAFIELWHEEGNLLYLQEAIKLLEGILVNAPPAWPWLATTYLTLGDGLRDRHSHLGDSVDLDHAIESFQMAVKLFQVGSENWAGALDNCGAALRGRYERDGTKSDLREAMAAHQAVSELAPFGWAGLPLCHMNRGVTLLLKYHATGNLADLRSSVGWLSRALKEATSPPSLHRACLHNLGLAMLATPETALSNRELEEAIALFRRSIEEGPDDPEVLKRQLHLAGALQLLAARTDDPAPRAEATGLRRSVRLMAPDGSRMWLDAIESLVVAAHPSKSEARDGEAWRATVEALRVLLQHTMDDDPFSPSVYTTAAIHYQMSFECWGDPADLRLGVSMYERACEGGMRHNVRATLHAARGWGRWASQRRNWKEAVIAYGFGVEAVSQLFARQASAGDIEASVGEGMGLDQEWAFARAMVNDLTGAAETLERGRARLLTQAFGDWPRTLERLIAAGHEDPARRYLEAMSRVSQIERTHVFEYGPGLSATEMIDQLRTDQLAIWRSLLEQAHAELSAVPEFKDWERRRQPATFSEIGGIAAAGDGRSIVYVGAAESGGLAVVVDCDGQVRRVLLEALKLSELIERTQRYFGSYAAQARRVSDWHEVLEETLQWIGEAVVGPVLRQGRPGPRWHLVPTGILGVLPIHAGHLPVLGEGGPRYLLDEVEVSYAANARAIARSRELASEARDDAVLAVEEPMPATGRRLRYSAEEVRRVVARFTRSDVLRRRHATKRATLERMSKYGVLHFSTHGKAQPLDPLGAGLEMAGHERLTVSDLMRAAPSASRLAFLSACETALPGELAPDEVIDLPTGLLHAGIACAVGTLWLVPEFASMALVDRYYEAWKGEGLPPAAALRRAQLWLRDATAAELLKRYRGVRPRPKLSEHPFSHPVNWAGFVCFGA